MKKVAFLFFCLLLVCNASKAQNFMTMYIPSYQTTSFKAENVPASNGVHGDASGSFSHTTFKGDGIVGNLVMGIDVTGIWLAVVRGKITSPDSEPFYGGGFDMSLGGAFNITSTTKLGAAANITYGHGLHYTDGTNTFTNYISGLGFTIIGLQSFGKRLYLMPKLVFYPKWKSNFNTDVRFETSIGFRLIGPLGVSITPGFEKLTINNDQKQGTTVVSMPAGYVHFSYMQYGISFMF